MLHIHVFYNFKLKWEGQVLSRFVLNRTSAFGTKHVDRDIVSKPLGFPTKRTPICDVMTAQKKLATFDRVELYRPPDLLLW